MATASLAQSVDNFHGLIADPAAIEAAVRAKPNVHPIAAAAAAAHAAAAAARAAAAAARAAAAAGPGHNQSTPAPAPTATTSSGRVVKATGFGQGAGAAASTAGSKKRNAAALSATDAPTADGGPTRGGRGSRGGGAAGRGRGRGAKTPRAGAGPTMLASMAALQQSMHLPGLLPPPSGFTGSISSPSDSASAAHWHGAGMLSAGSCNGGPALWRQNSCPVGPAPGLGGYHAPADAGARLHPQLQRQQHHHSQQQQQQQLPAAPSSFESLMQQNMTAVAAAAAGSPSSMPAAGIVGDGSAAAMWGGSAVAAAAAAAAAAASQHMAQSSGIDIEQHLDDPVMMELFMRELPIAQALGAATAGGGGGGASAGSPNSNSTLVRSGSAPLPGAGLLGRPGSGPGHAMSASLADDHHLDDWFMYLGADDADFDEAELAALHHSGAAAGGADAMFHVGSSNLDALAAGVQQQQQPAGDAAAHGASAAGSPCSAADSPGQQQQQQHVGTAAGKGAAEQQGAASTRQLFTQGSTAGSCDVADKGGEAGRRASGGSGAATIALPGTPSMHGVHPSSPSATLRSGSAPGGAVGLEGAAGRDFHEVTSCGSLALLMEGPAGSCQSAAAPCGPRAMPPGSGTAAAARASTAAAAGTAPGGVPAGPYGAPGGARAPAGAGHGVAGAVPAGYPPRSLAPHPAQGRMPPLLQPLRTSGRSPAVPPRSPTAAGGGQPPLLPASMVPALVSALKQPSISNADPVAAAIVAATLGGPAALAATTACGPLAAAAARAAAVGGPMGAGPQQLGSSRGGGGSRALAGAAAAADGAAANACTCVHCLRTQQQRKTTPAAPGSPSFPVTAGLQNPALTHMMFSAALSGAWGQAVAGLPPVGAGPAPAGSGGAGGARLQQQQQMLGNPLQAGGSAPASMGYQLGHSGGLPAPTSSSWAPSQGGMLPMGPSGPSWLANFGSNGLPPLPAPPGATAVKSAEKVW